MFEAWILESYRAQAPKRLVKALDAQAAGEGATGGAVIPGRRRRKRPGAGAKAKTTRRARTSSSALK